LIPVLALLSNYDQENCLINVGTEGGVATIRRQLHARAGSGSELNTEQWSRDFKAWVHGHATTTPLLSDEAISRDSIYGARGL
jgi:hypothetical protein